MTVHRSCRRCGVEVIKLSPFCILPSTGQVNSTTNINTTNSNHEWLLRPGTTPEASPRRRHGRPQLQDVHAQDASAVRRQRAASAREGVVHQIGRRPRRLPLRHHERDLYEHVARVLPILGVFRVPHPRREQWTCHDGKCSGSCQSLRDLIEATFPKKGLGILSTWAHTVEDRKLKFKNVLIHLLRSVLLPGSTMKCFHARQQLPPALFEFLGVEADADKRTLLQVYVDNHQGGIKKSATTADLSKLERKSSMKKSATTSDLASMSAAVVLSSESSRCMVCLEDVGLNVDAQSGAVELQCKHKFHRECIFEWLTFQYHCPVCRTQVGPSAMTNYCRPKNQVQWWLGNFTEDPLKPDSE